MISVFLIGIPVLNFSYEIGDGLNAYRNKLVLLIFDGGFVTTATIIDNIITFLKNNNI